MSGSREAGEGAPVSGAPGADGGRRRAVLDAIRARARERPDHPALVVDAPEGPRRVSYAALVERMDEGAARLAAAGVAPGQRCGLLAGQGPGFVEEALSILAADACLVPIPPDHAGATLARFAEEAALHHRVRESDAGFARASDAGFAHEACGPVPAVDGAGEAVFRALDPAYLRFTSGTTSRRKGVILSHGRIAERLEAANAGLAIGPDDRVLWLLPMAHHFVVSILLYLRFGATILLPRSPLARPVLELAAGERATVLYASPSTTTCSRRTPRGSGSPTCASPSPPRRACAPTWRRASASASAWRSPRPSASSRWASRW